MVTINVAMDPMKNIVNSIQIYTELPSTLFLGHCQGDIYACLQGNNVSCRLACATYGRVTCITYQNQRACEQYNRESHITHFNISSTNDFDALQYSAYLAIGILIFLSILSIFIYFIRKKPLQFLSSWMNTKIDRSSSHYISACDIDDLPPPYPGPPLFSSLYRSESIYYATIKTPTISTSMSMLNPMPLPEPFEFTNLRTHSV